MLLACEMTVIPVLLNKMLEETNSVSEHDFAPHKKTPSVLYYIIQSYIICSTHVFCLLLTVPP